MGKRGMGLFMVPVDWQQLLYIRPDALVCMDAYHLPPTPAGGVYALWRPWTGPRQIRRWTPTDWLAAVASEWYAKGQPHFDAIQFGNEPNLELESGYPSGSREAAAATVAWGRAVIPLIRATWPGVQIASPPLSPCVEPYRDFWEWLRPLVNECGLVNVHRYFDNPYSLGDVHRLYPEKEMVVTEIGRPAGGTAAYGQEIRSYWQAVEVLPYVKFAAPFVWQVVPEFAAWGLAGTAAARVLRAEYP